MMRTILGRGAEAVVYFNENVEKERTPKRYRHPYLDKQLRCTRLRREAKILEKLYGEIPVPRLLSVDERTMTLTMEHVQGELLRLRLPSLSLGLSKNFFYQIGYNVARMHSLLVIHGDLTTSNMILRNEEVVFIDFGLAFVSAKVEDMAVDLHLLRQALESAHYTVWQELWKTFLEGYSRWEGAGAVLDRLAKVDNRGRYKRKKTKQPQAL